MSPASVLQPLLGGIGLSLPVYALLVLNGNVFGISGFVHRAVRGDLEAMVAVVGLISGGIATGMVEGAGPKFCGTSTRLVLISGFLIGIGSKMANGCTSGHMICGLSRLSKRSFAATLSFFAVAMPVAQLLYSALPPPEDLLPTPSSLDEKDRTLLALQGPPLLLAVSLYFVGPANQSPFSNLARLLVFWTTTFDFSLALRLSGLVDCDKVLGFLLVGRPAFDPSLLFLALGAIPSSLVLYHFGRWQGTPKLSESYTTPTYTHVDARLLCGAALFGVGWGISGLCPGPALVNLGRAIVTGVGWAKTLAWLSAFVAGGLAAPA